MDTKRKVVIEITEEEFELLEKIKALREQRYQYPSDLGGVLMKALRFWLCADTEDTLHFARLR